MLSEASLEPHLQWSLSKATQSDAQHKQCSSCPAQEEAAEKALVEQHLNSVAESVVLVQISCIHLQSLEAAREQTKQPTQPNPARPNPLQLDKCELADGLGLTDDGVIHQNWGFHTKQCRLLQQRLTTSWQGARGASGEMGGGWEAREARTVT